MSTAATPASTQWTKRAAAAAETREAILAAARRVIAEIGFEKIRMRMVAEAAEVSTATLHYHFETREKLFAEALRYSFEHTGAEVYERPGEGNDSATARLARIISASLPTTPSLRQEWAMWQELWCRAGRDVDSRVLADELYRQQHQWIADTLRDGIASGEFRDCDAGAHAKLIGSLCDGYGVQMMIETVGAEEAKAAIWSVAAAPLGIQGGFPEPGRDR